ncbi:DUF4340 domain-containing protein [Chryseosolibacter indicus]|uniref:DUF4340 domain-containing protein n=1 Tax=Chryseosolibacter indicus TaxID=2782351 RepID=A0ABS5VR82_9BACT|nr:DUF4340 domain-containing protein [Chryseosolibacter indicus]MBT1703959.1 DUF4340 domain-containing protein [Chryseosolibacter indicus]
MKKVNNKTLFLVLVLLAIVFISTRIFHSPVREGNLDKKLFAIDTSNISEISLKSKADQFKEISLVRDNDKNWKVKQNTITSEVERYPLNNLLNTIGHLNPERIVSRKKEKWGEYNVSDTADAALIIKTKEGEIKEFHVGKETMGSTYMRIGDEKEVYAVAGNILDVVNKKFTDWRERTFLRLDKKAVTKISFKYPADSAFFLERKNKTWFIGNEIADSIKVQEYLNKAHAKDLAEFADDFKPTKDADIKISLEGDATIELKAWHHSFYEWVLNSSARPNVYFLDKGKIAYADIFVPKQYFLKSTSNINK